MNKPQTIKQQLKSEGYKVFWYMKANDLIHYGVAKKGGEFFTIHYMPYRSKASIQKGVDFNPGSPTPDLKNGIKKAIAWVKENR